MEVKIATGVSRMNDKIRKEQIKEILRQSRIRDVKFEDAIESIVCRINDAVEEKERALRQLEEWNKDEELTKVREELKKCKDDMRRGFQISEDEQKDIQAWIRRHEEYAHGLKTLEQRVLAHGCSGGGYTYMFYPTGIGTIGIVKCNACGDAYEFQRID